ncbi:YceI family protein [Hymenobacter sp. RP-2-7]|uniref:YceI family protein n=1 Tax=Hymenobacter polaris TaxID=2682546 RepID=A0A7Y0FL05_9BACT|nr:YceI family protein [Hymenobacter polaris]NML63869.1 YceI family protein [Hymenobacter polaris]
MPLLLLWSWLLTQLGGQFTQQPAEPAVRFEIVNAGFTVQGTLGGLQAMGQFDPAQLAQAHIRATVPVSTIQTGISLRDKHLQKPDYFDAAQFPVLSMQSTAFRSLGGGQYEGTFTLTIKGISHEVRVPFTVSAARELQGSFHLNRLDYGIGKSSLVLANDVAVSLRTKLAEGP